MESYSKEEDQESSSTPFLTPSSPASRSKRQHKSWFFHRHRLFTLSFITLICTSIFTVYFKLPSTLWIYLTAVWVLLPVSILHDLFSLLSSKGNLKIWLTRGRTTWISLEMFGIFLLCSTQISYSTRFFPTHSSLILENGVSVSSRPHGSEGAKIKHTPKLGQMETFFIAANLYQSENILPTFTKNLLELSEILGKENIFISIYESNSVDSTKSLLKAFDNQLFERGIRRKIVTDDFGEHLEADAPETSGRIKMLAHARNKAQSAFYEASEGEESGSHESNHSTTGMKFDKVLWINDIVFETRDVLELITTNQGDFDQVCGMDFFPLGFYDTWVARSSINDRLKPLWPYFSSAYDVQRLRRNLPIEVNSCWNGMTSFDAKWFYANHTSPSSSSLSISSISNHALQSTPPSTPIKHAASPSISLPQANLRSNEEFELNKMMLKRGRIQKPINASAPEPPPLPLRFRASERCFSSECLLISYDLHRGSQTSGRRPKILINPNVRVAYDHRDYFLYSKLMRFNIVAPWRLVWQDLISNRLFGWLTDLGRKGDRCNEVFNLWFPPPPEIPSEPEYAVEKV